MKKIVDIYTEAVHGHLKPMFANWEPGKPIKLGDFGTMNKKRFIHEGNIKNFGIKLKIRKDEKCDNREFTSGNKTEISFIPKGKFTDGNIYTNASLKVEFGSEQGVLFNAVNCKHDIIINKQDVGDKIIELYNNKKWEKDWVIITEIVKSGSTTILVSGSKSSSIVLEADANIKNLNLIDTSLKLKVKNKKNIGYSQITTEGLIPLLSLSKLQDKILSKPKVRPVIYNILGDNLKRTPPPRDEYESETELVFDQLK